MTRVLYLHHIWPEGEDCLPKLKDALGKNFKQVTKTDEADLIVYIRIPWNKLLKQAVKVEPEFKRDDYQRRLLKEQLSYGEITLDNLIESIEEEREVLILDSVFFESDVAIQEAAELIKIKVRG